MSYSYNIAGGGVAFIFSAIVGIAFWVGFNWLMFWKVFEKAGKEPWKAIIPVYNYYVIIEIVGRPVWWFWIIVACYVGMIIPILDFIAWIPLFVMILLIALDMARCFGKSNAFGIGLWLLSIIFYPILGFGEARYLGPLAAAGAQAGGGGYAPPPAPGEPMAPAHVPWQSVPPIPGPAAQPMMPPPAGQGYVPPTPGPAAQPMTPPPPLAQPLQPQPLSPPPAQPAPYTTPPAEGAAPTPPPAEPATPESPTPPPPPPVT